MFAIISGLFLFSSTFMGLNSRVDPVSDTNYTERASCEVNEHAPNILPKLELINRVYSTPKGRSSLRMNFTRWYRCLFARAVGVVLAPDSTPNQIWSSHTCCKVMQYINKMVQFYYFYWRKVQPLRHVSALMCTTVPKN